MIGCRQPMRIISGTAKGRRLQAPTWEGLRPTSDRLRETLFNILAPRVEGARVLDGYAGTGAIGIEALSRGAAHVTFVENDPRAVRLVQKNIENAGVSAAKVTILRQPFSTAAERAAAAFDIVILDPPYADSGLDDAVRAALAILSDDGVVVLEHATRVAPPEGAFRTVKSGDSSVSFYRNRP